MEPLAFTQLPTPQKKLEEKSIFLGEGVAAQRLWNLPCGVTLRVAF